MYEHGMENTVIMVGKGMYPVIFMEEEESFSLTGGVFCLWECKEGH